MREELAPHAIHVLGDSPRARAGARASGARDDTARLDQLDDDGLGGVLGLTLGLGLGGLCILTIVGVCIYRARARNLAAAKAAKRAARTTGFAPGDPVRV